MKKIILSLIFIICIINVKKLAAQTGIAINTDGSAADGSALLDIKATDKGMLVPRMTLAQRTAIVTPATGLLLYQTDGTAGFYYNSGTPGAPTWAFIQNSGNANVTLQGNTFNGANQLVQLNGSAQLPAISGVNLTALNASNLASGTVSTARLGTGTANSTTFLRGDNTWVTPASGGTGHTFVIGLATPGNVVQNWTGLNGSSFATFGVAYRSAIMPSAGTFDALYVVATISSGAGSNTVTVTLYKNGAATALTVTITVSAIGVTVTGSDLGHPIPVAVGDQFSIGMIQTNMTPVTQLGISTHFQ